MNCCRICGTRILHGGEVCNECLEIERKGRERRERIKTEHSEMLNIIKRFIDHENGYIYDKDVFEDAMNLLEKVEGE